MSAETFESAYPAVMEDIARRIIAAEMSLAEVRESADHPFSWVGCEVAVLQLRKLCELFLLGSTIAHLEGSDVELDPKKWRPKDAFSQLGNASEHATQVPVTIQFDLNGPGAHHITPKSRPLPFQALSVIYGICGDLLHVPTAQQVFKGKLPSFDVDQLTRWLAGLRELAQSHVLMLPQRQKIYLCFWNGGLEQAPELVLLSAEGDSTLKIEDYPPFALFP